MDIETVDTSATDERTTDEQISEFNNMQLIVWQDLNLFVYRAVSNSIDVIDLTGDDTDEELTTKVKIEDEVKGLQDTMNVVEEVKESESESEDSDATPVKGKSYEFTYPELNTNDDSGIGEPAQSSATNSSSSQAISMTTQITEQPYNPDFMRKYIRTRIRTPFLEDSVHFLFVHRIREIDRDKLWGLTEIPNQKRRRFYFVLKRVQKPRKEVKTDAHIIQIRNITTRNEFGVWYPMFEVLRSDSRVWSFSEADFANLCLQDIDVFYHYFRNLCIKPIDIQAAQRAVVRFMKMTIRLAMITDFQIGIECDAGRINLKRPRQDLENIKNLPVNKIVKKPDHGVVYQNAAGKKKFMRFSELKKYSDGTIYSVRNALKARIDEIRPTTRLEFLLPSREIFDIQEAFEIMKETDVYRRGVRRFENYFGYRKESRWSK